MFMLKSFTNYIKEVRAESKKVTWPNKNTVVKNTYVVIISSVVIGLVIASMDWVLSETLKVMIK